MRKLLTLSLLVALAGCGGHSSPMAPPLQPCEAEHFGTIVLTNGGNVGILVLIDGINYGTAGSNGGSVSVDLPAGAHTVETRFPGFNVGPCAAASPTVSDCHTTSLCCAPTGAHC